MINLNKLLPKSIYYLSGLSLMIFACALASQLQTQAQEDSYCYMVDGFGQRQNLNSLCGTGTTVDRATNRNAMIYIADPENNPNIDYKKIKLLMPLINKGREYMRAEKYQEAISMFTQAVNEYPDFATAYMGRAYSKHMLRMNRDSVIEDFRNAENAYRRTGQVDYANNMSRQIQQYRSEKLESK